MEIIDLVRHYIHLVWIEGIKQNSEMNEKEQNNKTFGKPVSPKYTTKLINFHF